jgi:hypothetical protein
VKEMVRDKNTYTLSMMDSVLTPHVAIVEAAPESSGVVPAPHICTPYHQYAMFFLVFSFINLMLYSDRVLFVNTRRFKWGPGKITRIGLELERFISVYTKTGFEESGSVHEKGL